MNLAQMLRSLPAINVSPGDEQGTWVLFMCHDCNAEFIFGEVEDHLQSAHGMSRDDSNAYIAYLIGGPRYVRQMQNQNVEVAL